MLLDNLHNQLMLLLKTKPLILYIYSLSNILVLQSLNLLAAFMLGQPFYYFLLFYVFIIQLINYDIDIYRNKNTFYYIVVSRVLLCKLIENGAYKYKLY